MARFRGGPPAGFGPGSGGSDDDAGSTDTDDDSGGGGGDDDSGGGGFGDPFDGGGGGGRDFGGGGGGDDDSGGSPGGSSPPPSDTGGPGGGDSDPAPDPEPSPGGSSPPPSDVGGPSRDDRSAAPGPGPTTPGGLGGPMGGDSADGPQGSDAGDGPFSGSLGGAADRTLDELRDGDPIDAVLDATPIDEVAQQDTPERVDDLTTRGGFFSEREEAELRSDAEAFRETFASEVREPAADAAARFGPEESATARRRSVGAGLGAVGAIANVPANLQRAETATEVATNADPEDVDDVAEAAAVLGSRAAVNTGRTAVEKPAALAGETLLGFGGGAVAGRAAGSLGRSAIDRRRTFGADEVDPEDLTSEDVLDGTEEFPGAADEDLYRSDPAAAVREQADANTPEEVASSLDEAGATGDADLKKALDQPIDDPEGGDAFGVPDDVAEEYEAPGSFVGPELSPNFLRVGERGSGGLSLTPGLPDLGNRPTGAVIRTDVENPDADTLEGFGDELEDRAGENTAITKPADEVNPGEAEAVVPPGARFPDADGGSADFYTTIEGRRVPIRTFGDRDGDADTPGATPDGDTDPSGFGRDRDGGGTVVDDVTERVDPRPDDGSIPLSDVPGSDFGAGGGSSSPTGGRSSSPSGAPSGGSSFGGGPTSGSPPGSGGGSSGGPFSGFSGFGFGGSGGSGGSGGGSSGGPFSGGGPSGGSPGGGSSSGGSPGGGTPGGPTEGTGRPPDPDLPGVGGEEEEPLFGFRSESDTFGSGIQSGSDAFRELYGEDDSSLRERFGL